MKTKFLGALVTLAGLCLLTPGSCLATGIGGFWSYWSPSDTDSGTGLGLRLATTSDPAGQLEIRASRFEDLVSKHPEGAVTVEATAIEAGMVLYMSEENNVRLYSGIGVGYYLLEGEVTDEHGLRETDMENEWGYYGVLGLEYPLGDHFSIFGEGVYRRVKSRVRGDRLDPEGTTRSIKFDGMGANVGLMLIF